MFSQKKLAKLKKTEQTAEPVVNGRNAAILQVFIHNKIKMYKGWFWCHTLFLQTSAHTL